MEPRSRWRADGGYDASGMASWYGEEAAGHRTASGDLFDPDGITAAHRSLPLGSLAEVTSVDTGRSVVVRINDRGPGRRDRIIDLSRGAARALGYGSAVDRNGARTRGGAGIAGRVDQRRYRVRRVACFGKNARAGVGERQLRHPDRQLLQPRSGAGVGRPVRGRDRTVGQSVAGPAPGRIQGAAAAQEARDAMAARGYGDARILPAD